MFMPSPNNYNTRSQIALDALLFRTIKGQKCMSFLSSKIWINLKGDAHMTSTLREWGGIRQK